ncbi:hypothetical protein BgiBS90_011927 [Biomphalaria glabrata]|uniref:Uncharacterized protein n=1 Tax=Biomphalaria glabrata TaxID=6526 RepID=A0A2C9L4Y1_BIOGL|nr:hypothetical protein BgiBS90_011927 [Biomphalaria glabrata]
MSLQVVDLEQLVKDHAEKFLEKDQKKEADLISPRIDWSKMTISYGDTKYANEGMPSKPVTHVLFSTTFSNDTPITQTYTLKTERRTRSTCEVYFHKTFTYGAELKMTLLPPNPIIDINAGFKADVTKEKSLNRTIEQELLWGMDSEITVSPGHQTKAELVIQEGEMNGEFEMLTTFDGKVLVTYEHKKSQDFISTIYGNVSRIFVDHGFTPDDLKRPTFLVKGDCKCRFGIDQFIRVTETPLVKPGDSGQE